MHLFPSPGRTNDAALDSVLAGHVAQASSVIARVVEALPHFGLVYSEDDEGRTWTITRRAVGPDAPLLALEEGQRVRLHWIQFRGVRIVTGYRVLPESHGLDAVGEPA